MERSNRAPFLLICLRNTGRSHYQMNHEYKVLAAMPCSALLGDCQLSVFTVPQITKVI